MWKPEVGVAWCRDSALRGLLWEWREELWAVLSEIQEEEGMQKLNTAQISHTSGAFQSHALFYRCQIRQQHLATPKTPED